METRALRPRRKGRQASLYWGRKATEGLGEGVMVVVQSLNHVWLSVSSRTAALRAPLSFTASQSLLKPVSVESVMLSNHLILCRPLLLLPSVWGGSGKPPQYSRCGNPRNGVKRWSVSRKARNKQVFARWRVGKCIPGRKNSCAVLGMRAACSGPMEVLKAVRVDRSPILRSLVYHRKTLGFIPGKLLEDFKLGDNLTRFVIQWMVSGRH